MNRRQALKYGALGLGAAAAAGALAWLARAGRQSDPEHEDLYDDARFRHTDPALVRYRELAPIPTGLLKPRGLALAADGRLYLAGDRTVAVVGADGGRIADWPCQGETRVLAVRGDGTVLVGLRDRIQMLTEGTITATWEPPSEGAVITCLAAQADGDVYAADAGNRTVWRYRNGKPCGRLGGDGDDGFIIPSPYMDVRIGPDGTVWVADTGRYRIEGFAPDGTRRRAWGHQGFDPAGFCGCCNPANFAICPDGRFITAEKGLPRVKRYSAQGEFECVVAPTESFPPNAVGLDLAVAADGRVLVLDPAARAVRVFVPAEAG
jgi:hypothetical protein